MKDAKKQPELPPQPRPQAEPKVVSKERQTPPEALQNLAAEAKSPVGVHATLLGDASTALPANTAPLAAIMEQLQHNYGNTYVQQVISEMDTAQAPAARQRKQPEPAVPSRHRQAITPRPPRGTIDAAGHFTVTYVYRLASDANVLPLTLSVPAGVTVTARPLTEMTSDALRIHDPGSTGRRTVTMAVSLHQLTVPNIQVAFTQGTFTYTVIFEFLPEYLPPPARQEEEEADEEGEES